MARGGRGVVPESEVADAKGRFQRRPSPPPPDEWTHLARPLGRSPDPDVALNRTLHQGRSDECEALRDPRARRSSSFRILTREAERALPCARGPAVPRRVCARGGRVLPSSTGTNCAR